MVRLRKASDVLVHNYQMELYSTLETLLSPSATEQKIALFKEFMKHYKEGKITRDLDAFPLYFDTPSYEGICVVADPKEVPRRTGLNTVKGQILLLHAIAHIEYSAIDLALDAVYRFRNLGEEFEKDWLEVAEDEVRHFEMLQALLKELESGYGNIPVHNALFESSQRTQTLLERMAVVPRYLEANGLDATPQILKKLIPFKNDPIVQKIIGVLQIILDEEVEHVRKGDRWFDEACRQEGVDRMVYFDIIENHYPSSFPRKISINCSARKQAGFTEKELQKISSSEC